MVSNIATATPAAPKPNKPAGVRARVNADSDLNRMYKALKGKQTTPAKK